MFINKEGKIENIFNSTLKKQIINKINFLNSITTLSRVLKGLKGLVKSEMSKNPPPKPAPYPYPNPWPTLGGRGERPERPVPSFNVSFQAYPCELKFDPVEIKEESISSSDTETVVACSQNSNQNNDNNHDEILFESDDLQLTDFYFDNKGKEKEEELNKKINKYRCFYLVNDKYWTISLKNKDLYKSYKNTANFIGNKFKEILQDDDEMALVVQIVNERFELKSIGKYLFYRELYLHTFKNTSVKKLFKNYVGGDEQRFLFEERENVHFYRWKFTVHKNRLGYVVDILKRNFNVNSECIKSIKNYDDVLKYFLNH